MKFLGKPWLDAGNDTQASWNSDFVQTVYDSPYLSVTAMPGTPGTPGTPPRAALAASLPGAGTAAASTASSSATTAASTTTTTTGTASGTTATPSWIANLSDSVLKADMTAAASGGTVTEAAMAKLFTDLGTELAANKSTLSASQLADLKTIAADINTGETASAYVTYLTNAPVNGNTANAKWTGGAASAVTLGNLAVGATATQVNELTGKWFLGTDLPSDVVSMSGYSAFTISYSAVSNPLFGSSGPSMNDINQGYLGDCYLLSALAEVAHQDPSIIQSMIVNNGNNTYGVRFYVNGVAEYVTVNNALPNGGTEFNYGADDWASLIEKAYAQLQAEGVVTGNTVNDGNAYSTIGNGGAPEFTLEEITGATAITDFSASGTTWSEYVYNNNLNYVSGTGRVSTASVLSSLLADLAAGHDLVLDSTTNAADSRGYTTLVAAHAMSIYGYDSATGELEIRNPWGTESGQTWDTTFEISLSTLLADGDTISTDNAVAPAAGSGGGSSGSTVTGALVSAAAGLQASAAVSSFSITDSGADVFPALTALGGDTKLTGIILTDTRASTFTLTFAQYSADTSVLGKISGPYAVSVTGALASAASALQAAATVSSFTISDSSADVSSVLAGLAADSKLSTIALTDSNALQLTYAQLTADAGVLAKVTGAYTLDVTGVTAAEAAAIQANTHVVAFSVTDTVSDLNAAFAAVKADTKLSGLTLNGTAAGETLNLTGLSDAVTVNMGGDTASAAAGLAASSLSFIGTPDAITLGSGAAVIDFAVQSSSGVETISNFQFGVDELVLNLPASGVALYAANTVINGVHAISIYNGSDPSHGVILAGLPSTMTAASLVAYHVTSASGELIIH